MAYYTLFSRSPHPQEALRSYMAHQASKDMLEEADKAFISSEAFTEASDASKLFSIVWRTCEETVSSLVAQEGEESGREGEERDQEGENRRDEGKGGDCCKKLKCWWNTAQNSLRCSHRAP